jgi:hypothetical protein
MVGIAAVAFVNLPTPFHGDQALWMVYTRQIDHGAALYSDLWDTKQPLIFYFFLMAGRLFGFDEVGVHILEALWLLGTAAVLFVTSRWYLRSMWARLAVPALAVGLYYIATGPLHQTQVEALSGLPIFLAMWFALSPPDAPEPTRWRRTWAGFFGSVAVLFKISFGPIVAAIWLAALVIELSRGSRGSRGRALGEFLIPIVAGAIVPIAIAAAYLSSIGSLDEAWAIALYVISVPGELAAASRRVQGSTLWFARKFAVVGELAAVAAVGFITKWRRGPMVIASLVWVVAGFITIILQNWWWQYHYLVILTPLAILAGVGVDLLIERAPRWLQLAFLGLALVTLAWSNGAAFAADVTRMAQHGFDPVVWGESYTPWAKAKPEADFLEERLQDEGSVYVFGDPLILHLTGNPYAISIHSWGAEVWTHDLWAEAYSQLVETIPDMIYVSTFYVPYISEHSPEIEQMLLERYVNQRSTAEGTWYVLSG